MDCHGRDWLHSAQSCLPSSRPDRRKVQTAEVARPDVLDAFYPDARTKLVGTRPNYEQAQSHRPAESRQDASRRDEVSRRMVETNSTPRRSN